MSTTRHFLAIVLIGVGATVAQDLWLVALKRLGVPTGSFALVGRWVAHLARGQFSQASIAMAEPVSNEPAIRWVTHCAVGTAFAAALVDLKSAGWVQHPTLAPAFLTGVATVAMPLFVMQPAMGSGFAASRTPTPLKNCTRSVPGWITAWLVAFPVLLVMAPLARRAVGALVAQDWTASIPSASS